VAHGAKARGELDLLDRRRRHRIGLYFDKGIKFVSLLYVLLLALAIRGLIGWRKAAAGNAP
jgi:hypothetical protein